MSNRLVIEALKKQRHKYAFDANLYKMGIKSIHTEKYWKKYEALTREIERLEWKKP